MVKTLCRVNQALAAPTSPRLPVQPADPPSPSPGPHRGPGPAGHAAPGECHPGPSGVGSAGSGPLQPSEPQELPAMCCVEHKLPTPQLVWVIPSPMPRSRCQPIVCTLARHRPQPLCCFAPCKIETSPGENWLPQYFRIFRNPLHFSRIFLRIFFPFLSNFFAWTKNGR